jgi:sugar phosphate isomerase/epimerase
MAIAPNRRQFLQTSTLLAAAAAGATRAWALADGESKRKFTMDLSCGMIGVKASPRESIALAKQYGFESVAPSVDYLAKLSDAELQEVLGELKAAGLTWGAAGRSVDVRSDDAAFAEGLKEVAAWAKGAQRAEVTRAATWISPRHDSLPYVSNFRHHATRIRAVAKVLDDHGLRLGLEYIGPKTSWSSRGYPFIHTMAELKELIAETGQKNLGFLLDSWHWYTAGETADDLLTLGNHDVVSCHLNDAPANVERDQQIDSRRELPCATGVIDVKAFLGALVSIGYDGPICAEPFYQPLREMPRDKALETTATAMKKAFALVE